MKNLVTQAHFKLGTHEPSYLTNSAQMLVHHEIFARTDKDLNKNKFLKGNFEIK